MLRINHETLYKQFKKYTEGVRANGRPPVFTSEKTFLIVEFIYAGFADNHPVLYAGISDCILEAFGKLVLMDTLRYFLHSLQIVKTIHGISLDVERVDCDSATIDAYYDEFSRYFLNEIPNSFVLNVNETGIREFVDARELTVVVPIEYDGDSIFIEKKRSKKDHPSW